MQYIRSRLGGLLWHAFIIIGLIGLFSGAPSTLFAQAADAAGSTVALAKAAAPAAGTVLPFTLPGWATTALSIFGAVSIAYQAVIAWAHKRAAETADPADDQWLASLEAKPWFRILDRVFYWGGYAGSKLGGRKL